MSKAINSDGSVDAMVMAMCMKGLGDYRKEDVDRVLQVDDSLKQCTYRTLLAAAAAYHDAFGQSCWHVQKHLEIKAWQSSTFREFMGSPTASRRKKGKGVPPPPGDPLANLLEAQKAPPVAQEGQEEPPAEGTASVCSNARETPETAPPESTPAEAATPETATPETASVAPTQGPLDDVDRSNIEQILADIDAD